MLLKWEAGAFSYSCVDCRATVLCADCYHTQLKIHTKMGEGFWFKCCWTKHDFLKQPVEEWHGVKNGFIRIGAKEMSFDVWLWGVKEKWTR